MALTTFASTVRYHINQFIVDKGFAPTVDELASILNRPTHDIEQAFVQLADNHGLVLHPNSFKIWVAHPFSLAPTGFWVTTKSGAWWGNCALCSLGIAAMLKEDTTIEARLAGENQPIELQIIDGSIHDDDLLLNFCLPASKWWDNVIYTCSAVQYFQSVEDINTWSKRHDIALGQKLTIGQAWELAQIWYGNYLDPDWRKLTTEEAHIAFKNIGLDGEFWRLDAT